MGTSLLSFAPSCSGLVDFQKAVALTPWPRSQCPGALGLARSKEALSRYEPALVLAREVWRKRGREQIYGTLRRSLHPTVSSLPSPPES